MVLSGCVPASWRDAAMSLHPWPVWLLVLLVALVAAVGLWSRKLRRATGGKRWGAPAPTRVPKPRSENDAK